MAQALKGLNSWDPAHQIIDEKTKKLVCLMHDIPESQFNMQQHYLSLNTKIKLIDGNSDEFRNIMRYVENTHARTHNYKIIVQDIYSTIRRGEYRRMLSNGLHNHRMLWHGTRLSNFPFILKTGLLKRPPSSAPVSGKMFGDGVYFADCVTKSANYCFASAAKPDAILILAEVALGEIYEKKEAENITRLPDGKHSCKGVGRFRPAHVNPRVNSKYRILMPLGPLTPSLHTDSSLLYNEYIVYEDFQIIMQYLLHVCVEFPGNTVPRPIPNTPSPIYKPIAAIVPNTSPPIYKPIKARMPIISSSINKPIAATGSNTSSSINKPIAATVPNTSSSIPKPIVATVNGNFSNSSDGNNSKPSNSNDPKANDGRSSNGSINSNKSSRSPSPTNSFKSTKSELDSEEEEIVSEEEEEVVSEDEIVTIS